MDRLSPPVSPVILPVRSSPLIIPLVLQSFPMIVSAIHHLVTFPYPFTYRYINATQPLISISICFPPLRLRSLTYKAIWTHTMYSVSQRKFLPLREIYEWSFIRQYSLGDRTHYGRCDFSCVTYWIINHDGTICRSKITRDIRTDERTGGRMDGRTRPLIEMRCRI